MRRSPPLRFLAIVLGGWAALRTALLAPPWPAPPAEAPATAARARAPSPLAQALHRPAPSRAYPPAAERPPSVAAAIPPAGPFAIRRRGAALTRFAPETGVEGPAVVKAAPFRAQREPTLPAASASRAAGRWALSAWTFVRRGGGTALAAGGLLGGSQAGARLTYRVNRDAGRPVALSLRLTAPLGDAAGAEAGAGLDWRPVRGLPVHLLAERRQALGPGGRSAFSVTVHGGIRGAAIGPLRLDAYGQAGVAGIRSRDPFGDGSVRLSLPLGEGVAAGGGAWAAAQPGLSRLDVGPQARLRLPVAGREVAVAAEWRVRIAGNARPGSGPTLTLATDF